MQERARAEGTLARTSPLEVRVAENAVQPQGAASDAPSMSKNPGPDLLAREPSVQERLAAQLQQSRLPLDLLELVGVLSQHHPAS